LISFQYDPAQGTERALFVCAHGAGGNMNDHGISAVTRAMRRVGLGVVRFNFPYTERKSKRPDPMSTLTACFTDVVALVRREIAPGTLVIGGRSMGGRAASMLASEGFDADGLLLLAYPLHPPGHPEKLRDAHLPAITMPVLCLNGTRDTFCDPALMNAALRRVKATWTMHWLEGADHGFHVLKSSGRSDGDVMDEVATTTAGWLDDLV
jgi:uncharacterized protein